MEKKKENKILEQLSKLSKRELVMIYILLVVVILAGGIMLLIRPSIDTHDQVSEKLMEVQQQKDETDMLIAQIPSLQSEVAQYKKNIKKMNKKFNPVFVNEEIDSLVTGMVVASGLRPASLQIGAAQTQSGDSGTVDTSGSTNSSDTTSSDAGASTDSSGTSGSADGTQDPVAMAETDNAAVKSTAVTVKVKGTIGKFSNFIGRVAAKKGMAVIGFTVTNGEDQQASGNALSSVLNTQSKKSTYPYEAEIILEIYQSKNL